MIVAQGMNIDGNFIVVNLKKHRPSVHGLLRREIQAVEDKGGYSDSRLQWHFSRCRRVSL